MQTMKAIQYCQMPHYRHRAVVVKPDGTLVRVKNLDWLRRHASDVTFIAVHKPVIDWLKYDAVLVAGTNDGQVYATLFASKSLLEGWLERPSLAHVTPIWHIPKAS